MRNNREGQSSRSQNGQDFERLVSSKLERFLEKTRLENLFFLLGQTEVALANGATLKPDHVIRSKQTGKDAVYFGDKKSFRERWKLDDRDARMMKEEFPRCLWIEVTSQENDDLSAAQIQRNCENVRRQSKFDMVVSTSLPDSVRALFELLERHLTQHANASVGIGKKETQ